MVNIRWWASFVFEKLNAVAPETRHLVKVLDARDFAVAPYHFESYGTQRTLQQSFRQALGLCPNIDSIILDHHPHIDPSFLADPRQPRKDSDFKLRALSIVGLSSTSLSANFLAQPFFEYLVYLDASGVSGSILPVCRPRILPNLRILKLRGREADDASIEEVTQGFKLRLWSLDISDNKFTDASIEALRACCIPHGPLTTSSHFQIEGTIEHLHFGTPEYLSFWRLRESELSGSFKHPERYFVDTPTYRRREPPAIPYARLPGYLPPRFDSVDTVLSSLADGELSLPVEGLTSSRGLSHLGLSGTMVSSTGIQRLLRNSRGFLENLDIGCNPLLPPNSTATLLWPKSAKLFAHIGIAHLLRPVVSSNLQVLRVHHSLVTQIPSLSLDGVSSLARDYLSETAILDRVGKCFAQPFVPDMNPRLRSLTLTCIPRRSSGPLTECLIQFLKSLSLQERAIQDAAACVANRRGPGMLKGLRHLRLEFEPDAREEGFSAAEDFDAEDLMAGETHDFTFFEDERPRPQRGGHSRPSVKTEVTGKSSTEAAELHSSRVRPVARDDADVDHVMFQGHWAGDNFSLPVWTGSCDLARDNSALGTYRKLSVEHGIRDSVGPATPAQIQAGAPTDSYLFQDAWAASIMPPKLELPSIQALKGMGDVLEALKKYRQAGRSEYTQMHRATAKDATKVLLGEPHLFWTGNLEVATVKNLPHSREATHWR